MGKKFGNLTEEEQLYADIIKRRRKPDKRKKDGSKFFNNKLDGGGGGIFNRTTKLDGTQINTLIPICNSSSSVVKTNIRSDKPGRRCVASSSGDGGAWLVFVDTKSDKNHECFIWNPNSQIKVQLPCLPYSPDTFFKCCCYIVKSDIYNYKVVFYLKKESSFIWCCPTLQEWVIVRYSCDTNLCLACDAVFFQFNLYAISSYGIFYTQNDIRMSSNPSFLYERLLVVNYGSVGGGDENELFQVQRKAQCEWEVWKIDLLHKSWESVPNLEGKVVFLIGNYSAIYPHRPEIGLEGNCICFTHDGDNNNFYVFRLGDQSLRVFKNQPHSGFPVWFPDLSRDSVGMSWLSYVDGDAMIAEANDMPYGITQSYSERSSVGDNFCCKLPDDLWRLVTLSLDSVTDYANFRAVCKNWREIARPIGWKPEQLASSSSPSVDFPWLMLFPENESSSYSTFIDPTCNMRYYKSNSNQELSGCKIRYSNNGWLLATRGKMIFFYEPFSKTKISLPDIPNDTDIDTIAFSSSPTSSDWIIFAIFSFMPSQVNSVTLRSGNENWESCGFGPDETFISCGCCPVFHDNKFYVLARNGSLIVVQFDESDVRAKFLNTCGSIEPLSNYRRGFMVSWAHELYTIVIGVLGEFVNAYKLDFDTEKWNEVKSLGNLSIFISQTSSFAIPVTKKKQQNSINFPLFAENRCLSYKFDSSGFIYYDDDNENRFAGLGLYDRKELFCGTWLQPRVVRSYR